MVILLLIYRYSLSQWLGSNGKSEQTELRHLASTRTGSSPSTQKHCISTHQTKTKRPRTYTEIWQRVLRLAARARKRNCFKGMLGAPWTQNWTQKRSPTLSDIGTAGLIWKVVTLKIPLVSGTMGLKKMFAGLAIFWNRQIPLFKITVFARVTKTMNT